MDKLDEGLEPSSAEEQDDMLSMSDDDFLNMAFPDDEPEVAEEAPASEESTEGEEDENVLTEETSHEETEEEEIFEEEMEQENTEDEETTLDVNYEDKYKELLAPFKANGKEITVDNPEDLRRLAQMGVGFNAKMTALKPVRKVAKMLENEGLLEESKISYLIDLSKGNPDAINKLIKESGVNPLDIDTESVEDYKPETYTVDDKQLEFDEALIDLKQSPTVQKTLDVVSTKWDEASRRKLYDKPSDINVIDAQIQSGIFDQVMAEVDKAKILGRIPSHVSDIEAYNYIGEQMNAAGAFNKATPTTTSPVKPKGTTKSVQRNSRKRAAASRSKPTKQQQEPDNILDLSDEEFERLMPNYL